MGHNKRTSPAGGQYDTMTADPETVVATAASYGSAAGPPVTTEEGLAQEFKCMALVMMPEECPSLLYGDSFNSEKMAKRGIIQSQAAGFSGSADPQMRWLKADEFFAISKRGNGALFARFFTYYTNQTQGAVRYRLKHSSTRSIADNQPSDYIKLMPGSNYFNYNIADCNAEAGGSALATSLNSSTKVCARTQDVETDARWTWVNCVADPVGGKDTVITVSYTPDLVLPDTCAIDLVRWDAGNPKVVGQFTFTAGNTGPTDTVDIAGDLIPDFYTFVYVYGGVAADTNFDATTAGFRFDFVEFCAGLAQVPVDSAYQNIFQLGKGTIIAGSMRLTNMAAPLSQQGESIASQTREPWTWWNWYQLGANGTGSPLDKNASYRDRYLGKAQNGGYGWHQPFRKTQFELTQFCELDYDNLVIKDVWWDLEDDSDTNVFSLRSVNDGTWKFPRMMSDLWGLNNGQSGLGCDFWMTGATHINWCTDNKWPDADLCPFNQTIWSSTLDNLRFAPKVMSNKYHLGSLTKWLVDNARLAKKYVGPLLASRTTQEIARRTAQHFLGKDLTADGIKLLQQSYNVGDAIVSRLKGGGM